MLTTTLVILGYTILVLLCFAGLALNLLGLPGIWLMVLGAVLYAVATGWGVYVGWQTVIALLVLGVLAEVVEFFAAAAGSKGAGGTKRGMIGAVVGGIAGGIAGTFVLPIPVIGTIVGSIAGSFGGALLVERMISKDNQKSIVIGIGAAKGRAWGIALKSIFGCAMAILIVIAAIPI